MRKPGPGPGPRHGPRPAGWSALAFAALIAAPALFRAAPAPAATPDSTAAADSIAAAAAPDTAAVDRHYPALETSSAPPERIQSRLTRTGEERDRLELGVARPEGYFDALATFGYRRFLKERWPFEHSLQIEIAGGAKNQLTEGAMSVYYLLRPVKSFRPEWRLRPLLEIGPGAHIAVQVADIEGFDERGFHTRAFLKSHLIAGVEFLMSRRFGLLARGRLSVPDHHPFDYAQAAIFLR